MTLIVKFSPKYLGERLFPVPRDTLLFLIPPLHELKD